ncbi:MAG: hypothetical protein OXH00_24650 [Candidatus Poribacteria bacterium]|nr:hypothetical protein [Candidatus Poribacteria bacterium]
MNQTLKYYTPKSQKVARKNNFIRIIHQIKRLKAKGLLPEALIATTEATQRLMPPIDNLLI